MARVPVDVPNRSERHKGPGGPHPRAKIPEGKVDSDFVSPGADLATYSVPSRHRCRSWRTPPWNFLAKRAAHSKHLIWFSSATEALLFAPLAIWVLTDAVVKPQLEGASCFCWRQVPCTSSIRRACSVATGPAISPWCIHWHGEPVLCCRSAAPWSAAARASRRSLAAAGSTPGHLWNSALPQEGWPLSADSRNHAGLFWGIATGCVHRGLHAGRWLLCEGAVAFARPGGIRRQPVSGCGSVFWGVIAAVLRYGRNMRCIGRKHRESRCSLRSDTSWCSSR